MKLFAAVMLRELRSASRRGHDSTLALVFFLLAAMLFPLTSPPDAALLTAIGGGVLWLAALFAIFLGAGGLFAAQPPGLMEKLALAELSLEMTILAKMLACWLRCGAPLAAASPLCALLYGLPASAALVCAASLLLGTPLLTLMTAAAAALVQGARQRQALLALTAWPLAAPALIFGAGAVSAASRGGDPTFPLTMLAALLAALAAPSLLLAAAAMRSALAER